MADRLTERDNALKLQTLSTRIQNFKEPDELKSFGKLLLHDILYIRQHESEREFHIFLFEAVLICCKLVEPPQAERKKSALKKYVKEDPSERVNSRETDPLRIKGRVFFRNVTGAFRHLADS